MAKPIKQTPVLEGEDAIRFMKVIFEVAKVRLTESEKEVKDMMRRKHEKQRNETK